MTVVLTVCLLLLLQPRLQSLQSGFSATEEHLILSSMNEIISCSRKAESIVHNDLCNLDHEEAWGLFLTRQNTLISIEMLSKGTLDATSLDSRTVLRRALLNNAGGIILLHNHPSGNPMPSKSDIDFTDKLHKACDLMGIGLLDHIIVSGDSFYSFSEEATHNYA